MFLCSLLLQGLPEVGTVSARDAMDDGSPIVLSVTIDRRDGSAVFDFEGTGELRPGGVQVRQGQGGRGPQRSQLQDSEVAAAGVCEACLMVLFPHPPYQGCTAPI
jgi:N-methylhydantoinase B/oxoprolinase/acetone carboxylase alpha subunit